MVAVSLAKIITKKITHMTIIAGETFKDFSGEDMSNAERTEMKQDLKADFEAETKKVIVSILNLAFGSDPERELFWERINSQSFYDFSYRFEEEEIRQMKAKGCLISALSYHLGIQLRDKGFQLFREDQPFPFSISDIVKLVAQTETFTYSKHKMVSHFSCLDKLRESGKYFDCRKLLSMRMEFNEYLGRSHDYSFSMAELSDIYLLEKKYSLAQETCKKAISKFGYFSPK